MTISTSVEQLLSFLRQRKRAYQLVFRSPAGAEVLEDLAKFCRASDTCFDPDPRIHAALEGRREVWLRIQEYLDLTPEQLAAIKSGNRIQLLNGKAQDETD